MLICLIPPSPHPTVLYELTFPTILPLQHMGPNATLPAAWSSQLQIMTSFLRLEPPSSIHMLDRAVGLVARVAEVTMNISRKEFVVKFIDEQVTNIPMNSDCVRMLLGVVLDIKCCRDAERQRNSIESSSGSAAGSTDDHSSGGSPTKPPKLGKHKRQRSLLFSLISTLVPKSLSSSSRPPPSSAPPPTPPPPSPTSPSPSPSPALPAPPAPLPFLPVASHRGVLKPRVILAPDHPDFFRKRVRATLADVWRRHVVSAISPQHLPAAGYLEWVLVAMASDVRAEIESIEASNFHGFGGGNAKAGRNRHRKTQSESRHALDFGDRNDDHDSEPWRRRAPSPFPDMLNVEDTDQVLYPRRGQADEWGVRYARPRSVEAGISAIRYPGHDDSLFGERFIVGDDPYGNGQLMFGHNRMGEQEPSDMEDHFFPLDLKRPGEFILDCNHNDGGRRRSMIFDMSKYSLVPSDIEDGESDASQTSIQTPEDGEELLLAPSVQDWHRGASHSAPASSSVSRVTSSRPRSRNASPSPPSSPTSSIYSPSSTHHFVYTKERVDDFVGSQFDYLDQIYDALDVVRGRAHEEGWRLVKATLIGAKNEWMDAEGEKSLEIKAKRRAWSSGIKVSAPFSASRFTPKVWDGSLSFLQSPMRPPGLNPTLSEILKVRGPIVPTGLSLGVPTQSSPLATYVWGTDEGRRSAPSKYGAISSVHAMETMEFKRSSRVNTTDTTTNLFPVYEDEHEGLFESAQLNDNAVGFPRTAPHPVPVTELDCHFAEEMEHDEDLFFFYPSRPRSRTTSMYVVPPSPPPTSSPPILPMFRPTTPPPSYQIAVGEDVSSATNDVAGKLDESVLLRPLSSMPVSSPPKPTPVSHLPSTPRPRAVSLPSSKAYPGANKTRRTSFDHNDEHIEDLSRAYASPPPKGPLIVSATPAPHEEYPRYAHIHSPISTAKKSRSSILGKKGKEVVFEQSGTEFTVGIEVALGRAEEGRVVW